MGLQLDAGGFPKEGKCEFLHPHKLTRLSLFSPERKIKGKVGRLNIELVKNQLRSLQTHYCEEGLDWQKELRQISKEKEFMKDLNLTLDDLDKERAKSI